MKFGQIVVGPPGSGKTTYCKEMATYLEKQGRKVAVVNLDPGNDGLPYHPAIDISDLVTIEDIMEHLKLGPNGSFLYAMEFLEQNFDWLKNELNKVTDSYLIIDCPGQIELYIDHHSIRNVIQKLSEMDYRLAAVHIVDSHHCTDPGKFISVLLQALASMVQLHLPNINVLSKLDLEEIREKLPFQLEYFTEVLNLDYLLDLMSDDPFLSRYKDLNKALCGLIDDFSLVNFIPLNIKKAETLKSVQAAVDKANGYCFKSENPNQNIFSLLTCAMGENPETSVWES